MHPSSFFHVSRKSFLFTHQVDLKRKKHYDRYMRLKQLFQEFVFKWLCLSTNGLRVLTLQNTPQLKDWGVKQTKHVTDCTQETWTKPLKITRFARKLDPTFQRKAFHLNKKSLKIPKGQSETVYRRRTRQHNGQMKKHKRTNNDRQNIHIKLKIE